MVISVINQLPDSVLLRIFSYCNSKIFLWRLRIVCKHWYILLADNQLWRVCNLSYFPFDNTRLFGNITQYIPMDGLKYLEISDNVINTEALHMIIESTSQLQGLKLNGCELRPDIKQPYLPQLLTSASSQLSYLDVRKTKGDLRILSDLIQRVGLQLNVLGISNTFRSILLIKARPFMCYLGNLTILECHDCPWMNDETIRDIGDSCPSLKALDATKCLNIQGTSIEKLLRKCTNIQSLILPRTSIRDEEMLRARWKDSRIKVLDLSHCYYLHDYACRHIVRTLAPQLKHLCCAFTDDLLQDLALIPNLPLKSLELRRRDLLDMTAVTNFLSNCNVLASLDLTLSPVDYQIFHDVLPNLPRLKWISFAGHEVLNTAESLGLLTAFCKHLKQIGINYHHAYCEPSLEKVLINFLIDNKNVEHLNLEGVYMNEVVEGLQRTIANHPDFQQRRLEISKLTEFNLPATELSVENVGSKFQCTNKS